MATERFAKSPAPQTRALPVWPAVPPPAPVRSVPEPAFRRDCCVHELFEEQVERTPDALAVSLGRRSLTYRQLDRQAHALAGQLRQAGVGPEVVVGLCVDRSLEMVVGLLGILKAGGAYLPLEPAYPQSRLAFMLEDSQARVLLTQQRHVGRFSAPKAEVICLDAPGVLNATRPAEEADPPSPSTLRPQSGHLAYLIYTSGSTGQPKGVLVSHSALVNHCSAVGRRYDLRAEDRVLQFASLGFDVAAEELFPTLLSGATVVLRTDQAVSSAAHFARFLADEHVTVVNLPTSFWQEWVSALTESPAPLPAPLRLVITGTERVATQDLIAWKKVAGDGIGWINAYGTTETTITSLVYQPATGTIHTTIPTVPIGRPIVNTEIYVLDERLRLVPPGEAGELHLGGAGLARGYLNQPELTALKFIPNPFGKTPDARLYRTGDLVRQLPDGNLEFLGRIDDQIKIRGFRVEPGEIEATLRRHPGVRDAIVLSREGNHGEKDLAAYLVPHHRDGSSTELTGDTLRAWLLELLPRYMVPSSIVVLNALPLTPSGKLDRHALPAPPRPGLQSTAHFVAPKKELEGTLAAIWREVMGLHRIGVTDNFFNLGGHSLLAMRIISKVSARLGLELSMETFFEAPTIAELAERMTNPDRPCPHGSAVAITPVERGRDLPLSFAQQRLWFLDQLEPGSSAYNLPEAIRLKGRIDPRALQRSLDEIVRRHEALRTVFAAKEGRPFQIIRPHDGVPLPTIDLRDLPEPERKSRAVELAAADARHPFALDRGPLFRAKLFRTADDEHLLLLCIHHIASDGWSMEVLFQELSALYSAFSTGRPSPLPDPPVQYADFAVWQRHRLQGEPLERQLGYWRQQLAHLPPPLDLPADRPRPPVQTFNGASFALALPPASTIGVRSLSRQEDVTVFMLLLAAFQATLHRHTRRTDILVGTPMAGRTRAETEGLIGFFANTLVLRADISDDPTFRELLRRVRDTALGAFQCQDLPFERLVEELRLDRDPSRNPLFQVGFAWQNAPLASLHLPGLELEHVDLESGITRVDLELHVWETGGQIQGRLVYNRDLFDESNVRRLADDFVRLTDQILSTPDKRVSEIHLPADSTTRPPTTFPPLDPAEIESALLEDPAIAEVVVRERTNKTGRRRWIAYVVPAGRISAEALRTKARSRLPAAQLPHAFVPLTSLPLAPDGTLDEDALAGFAVLDADVARRWEDSLRAVPGLERAAVVVKESPGPIRPAHLSDVLLDWKPPASIATTPATALPLRAPHPSSGRPAIAHGAPLAEEAGAPMHLGETLHRAARALDRGIFYHEPDGSEIEQPYSALLRDAQKVVRGLRQLGLQPQAKIVLQLERSKDFLTAFWGCVLGGFVPVPLSIAPSYKTANSAVKKLQHAWHVLEKPLIIAGQRLAPEIESLSAAPGLENLRVAKVEQLLAQDADREPHPSQPDDMALLLLTSGSTGQPKGVMLSHRNLLAMAAGTAQANRFTPDDVTLNWMPLDHVGAISFLHLMAVQLGCAQVQVPKELILQQPLKWLDWIERHRATISWGPNFTFSLINERAGEIQRRHWDLSSMRFLVNAGEAVVPRTARRFIQLLTPHRLPATAVRPAFGMSETCSGITWSEGFTLEGTSDKDSFTALGPVIPGASMRVVDDGNRVLPEGAVGRLQFQGASLTAGYYENPQLNAEVFTPDGWFDTGDRGFLQGGRLTITGREKDVIIINGANIHSHEIEAAVEEIPGLEISCTAACAVREPGSDTDKLAIFFSASCDDDARLRELLAEIRQRITREFGVNPAFLVPLARERIPKTEIGKIQRAQLRQQLERGELDSVLKRVDVLSANVNTIPNWFYRKVWVRQQGRPRATPGATGQQLSGARPSPGAATLETSLALNPLSRLESAKPAVAEDGRTPPPNRCSEGREGEEPGTGATLVFLDHAGLGRALIADAGPIWVSIEQGDAYTRMDARHYRIDPRDPEHYRRVLAALAADGIRVDRVLHLWTYGWSDRSTELSQLEQAQERGLFSVLYLAQALVSGTNGPKKIELLAVSSHAQAATDSDPVAIETAPLLGLLKSIALEMPHLACRHVDLTADSVDADRAFLLSELQFAQGETEVAYRDGHRLVPRLDRIDFEAAPKQPLPWKHGGIYLLSGGLGGIGVEIAGWLLRNYQARLLLVGRTALPERSAWEGLLQQKEDGVVERIQALRSLEQLGGAVIYETADVCDLEQMRGIVAKARLRWQGELDGIIHLAQVNQEHALAGETRASVTGVLRPKMIGAWTLSQLLKDGGLFISFSSVNSFFGGYNYGAYAAANSFLESFAQHQRRAGAIQSHCLAWSAWDGIGMSRGNRTKEPAWQRGFHTIPVEQGIRSLLAALHHGASNLFIGLDGGNAHIRPRTTAAPARMETLCAYFTGKPGALPPGVVEDEFGTPTPCSFLSLAEMPVTAGGDIDRGKLTDLGQRSSERPRVAPRTATEQKLATLWEELLGAAQVGVEDNFFQLGGHSLLATQLVSRIRDTFGVELRLQTLFEAPTVAGLAAAIEAATPEEKSIRPLRALPRESEPPLSFAQQRLWFLEQLEPGCCAYNIPDAVRLSGWLDVAALEQSVSEIVRRHESLRTTFLCKEGRPVQVIAPPRPVHLPIVELRQASKSAQEGEVQRLVAQEARTPFHLARGPLLRATLLRLADDDHVLLLTMHHIVSDGWSMGVLFQELALLYKAFVQGKLPTLAELPVQYADFAVWQRDWLRGEVLDRQLRYWRKKLTGAPAVLELPTDRPRPAIQSFRGATLHWRLPQALSESIQALARQEDATMFMALLAAFQTLLHRYTGQEDILVGSPIAGRNRAETEGLIGFFVNTLVLRADLSGQPGFREVLRRARVLALEAYAHQDLPFEKLVEELQPERTLSHNPLFQVAFVLQNAPMESFDLPGLTLEPLPVDSGSVQFDLTLSMEETGQGLKGLLEFNTDLFDAATMTRLLQHFQTLLEGMVAAPDQPIATLPMLGGTERHRLLTEWNDTRVDYPRDRCLHEVFEAEAERRPNAVAVVFEEQQLTYGELNRRANQLAHHLRRLGLGRDQMAGICVERSLEMIVGLLGILKAGAAYVPLDPNYPKERLAFMLEDTRVPVLLTQQRLLDTLPKLPAKVVCLDRDGGAIGRESEANPASGATPESLAYVIYTSGSTGRPNGVMTPHRGVMRLVQGANYASFGPSEVFLQFATLSFDASTFEIWGALLNGARLAVFPARPPTLEELGRTLRRHQVTTLWLTAGLFHLIVDERPEDLKEVRQLLAGGDVLSVPHVRKFLQAHPQCRLINGYGPTENTTFTCCHTIRADDASRASIPIGRPIANTRVHILDGNLQPAPAGVPGELYIGGDGLARGYLQRPELTARKFIPDPFSTAPGARLYRSGDLARYLPDGTIEFLGRIDQQVKIRGYRVELEEIESALAGQPAVAQAAVVACSNARGEKSLSAYVVLRRRSAASMEELRRALRQSLPDYMMPSVFLELEIMPLTPNGKVDRKALPQPEHLGPVVRPQYVSPRDTLELQLTHLWENVLGRHSISVTDNFFECGGHSLLAVRLFAEIEKCLGKNLPLATLFQAPTIERLAAVLRQDGWAPPWSSLVAIQPGGSKPPFYCIHGVGGNVLSFHALAVHLGSDQPLYGLQSQGLDGNQLPQSRIEEMAAHYIKEIRTLQPKGPYAMGGMSFGGLVAYEMAQQLQAQGEKVALLALIDSFPLNHLGAVPERIDLLKRRIGYHWGEFVRLGFSEKLAYLQRKTRTLQRKFKNRVWQMLFKFYQVIEHPLPHALQNVKEANFLAARSYAPRIYPGQVTVFSSSAKGMAEYYDPQVIWGPLAGGGVQVHTIPGDHVTMIEEPHVRVLAQKLKVSLDATAPTGGR